MSRRVSMYRWTIQYDTAHEEGRGKSNCQLFQPLVFAVVVSRAHGSKLFMNFKILFSCGLFCAHRSLRPVSCVSFNPYGSVAGLVCYACAYPSCGSLCFVSRARFSSCEPAKLIFCKAPKRTPKKSKILLNSGKLNTTTTTAQKK